MELAFVFEQAQKNTENGLKSSMTLCCDSIQFILIIVLFCGLAIWEVW